MMDLVSATIILLIPFVIGCFILLKFNKEDVARCIGFFSLVPVLTNVILFSLELVIPSRETWGVYSFVDEHKILVGIPELVLISIIVYNYRRFFGKERLLRVFFVWGIVRWLGIFVYLGFLQPYPEPYFDFPAYTAIFFSWIFPSIYAIAGLVSIRKRFANKNSTTSP